MARCPSTLAKRLMGKMPQASRALGPGRVRRCPHQDPGRCSPHSAGAWPGSGTQQGRSLSATAVPGLETNSPDLASGMPRLLPDLQALREENTTPPWVLSLQGTGPRQRGPLASHQLHGPCNWACYPLCLGFASS